MSRDVCSSILQHLSGSGARTRSLSIGRADILPYSTLGSFLSSDAASFLADLSLDFKGATAEDAQTVVQSLSYTNSLAKLELIAYDEILELETAEILSNYFAHTSQLSHLHLRLKTGLQEDRNVEAATALLSGLASNASIVELRIEWHAATGNSGFREAMKSFYRNCRVHSLVVDMPPSVDQVQLLVEGLPQNPFVRSLEASCGMEGDQELFKPLAVMLTAPQSQGQSVPPLALETLKLELTPLGEDPDPSYLYDLVQRPISTLKSMNLKFFVDSDEEIAPLLQALKESKGSLDSFDLFAAGVDADKWCVHLQEFLPQLNKISSLAINVPNLHGLPLESKTKLYQSALLNTGLTFLSLEPVFSEGLQYKKSFQTICLRNKVHKILTGLQNKSTPLEEMPAILKLVQRECQQLGVNPERYNAELINAGLRFCAEPETFRAMGKFLARR